MKEKNEEAICILPGTHSKHIMVSNDIVTTFKTFVTGELFDILVQRSVLSNSVSPGKDDRSFMQGVKEALRKNLLNSIFSVRVEHVLHQSSPIENYQYLSGLIIGSELKELENSDATIYLVSEDPLKKSYESGLRAVGVKEIISLSANEALINGHVIVFNNLS